MIKEKKVEKTCTELGAHEWDFADLNIEQESLDGFGLTISCKKCSISAFGMLELIEEDDEEMEE